MWSKSRNDFRIIDLGIFRKIRNKEIKQSPTLIKRIKIWMTKLVVTYNFCGFKVNFRYFTKVLSVYYNLRSVSSRYGCRKRCVYSAGGSRRGCRKRCVYSASGFRRGSRKRCVYSMSAYFWNIALTFPIFFSFNFSGDCFLRGEKMDQAVIF
jgi:hypothetical protein